ncbi:MAG: bifunctional phosphoribosylaminoimidazolecarboxamide formyltransferase/IMP cyclohydrolase [Bdellovibrionales bacterium RBG_16_40_8]|nr:MAG: bifunctional phosphoribosylaminoimidazolecarboxamide formyltransferase/IMP cyclohydrolase [Bdellovibrionales bacterium RBG_16_40_8]
MFKNALVSCSNKEGVADFLRPLQEKGLRIVSTGGTAKYLREQGLNVIDVEEQTGFPEVMNGRVKTLHPKIHMALLARSDNKEDLATLEKFEVLPFDLVIGNLYPFEEKPSVETIDVGGPSFLRAAAKNFSCITVICNPKDYSWVAKKTELNLQERQKLAGKVFAHVSAYDAMIAKHYGGEEYLENSEFSLGGELVRSLRYGENPQQKAAWFRTRGESYGIHEAKIIQGKELSYNNLLDIEAAVSTLREFSGGPACVAVKHNNPCGVSTKKNPAEALRDALQADPQSVFGGIVACNSPIDDEMAEQLSNIFLEAIISPHFTAGALRRLEKKKNMRILEWPTLEKYCSSIICKTISGGFLVQTPDKVAAEWQPSWEIIGKAPAENIKNDLLFAWKVSSHLKSNAIAVASNCQTIGLGMGQVNRVDAVEQAISRMRKFHGNAKTPVLASDAFFPFSDSIDLISDANIGYVIQPGGSVKDDEVKAKAKEMGITLVLTKKRHFLH